MTEAKARVLLHDFNFVLRVNGKLFEAWLGKRQRVAWGHSPQGLLDAMCGIVHDNDFTRRSIQ